MKKLLLLLCASASLKGICQSVSISAPETADTALKVYNAGTGPVASVITKNIDNTGALIYGEHFGKGGGLRMRLMNAQNNNAGIYMFQSGNGDGLYIGSNKSKSANFYSNGGNTDTTVTVVHDGTGMGLNIELNNASNVSRALNLTTKGSGTVLEILQDNITTNTNAMNVTSMGNGYVATFNTFNPASSSATVRVNQAGIGHGLDIQLSNPSSGANGISITTAGVAKGLFVQANWGNAIDAKTNSIGAAAFVGENTVGEAIVGISKGGKRSRYNSWPLRQQWLWGNGVQYKKWHRRTGTIGYQWRHRCCRPF